jgi:hypothetical protein
MSKLQTTSVGKSTQQNATKQRVPSRDPVQPEGTLSDQELVPGHLVFGHGATGQAALLTNHGIPATQRQRIARQINLLQKNRHLQRLLAGADVQRSDLVIQRRNLSSPRFAGNATLEAIYNGTGTLKNGDESVAVRKVQHGIHDAGILYRSYGVDGIFGDETERCVRRFQRDNRISGDPSGEVGSATMEKLDQLFPAMALPSNAGDAYSFAGMLAVLCQWNSAMIRDLRNLHVHMVGDLEWADEAWDGTQWAAHPMPGGGETSGSHIYIATDTTNEGAAQSLYHEYQHARSPYSYRNASWAEEEERVYTLETQWEIDRGMTLDPSLTSVNPTTGETEVNPGGVTAQVETYPGLAATQPGEVIGKVGRNQVRVQLDDGRRIVRNAVVGDSVPGPRVTRPPIHDVRPREWQCPS